MRTRKLNEVYSPFEKGTVKYVLKDTNSAYGRRVYIAYELCILMFAHLESVNVKEGQEIRGDEVIGTIGNTGYDINSAYHLHVSAFPTNPKKLTAMFTVDPTFFLKLAPFYCTNTLVSNGYGSKYCNPKLKKHEGIDFGLTPIANYETERIEPLYQDYRLRRDYKEDYT